MFKKGFVATTLLLGTLGLAHADTQKVLDNITQNDKMATVKVAIDTKMTKLLHGKLPELEGYVVDVGGSRLLSNGDGTMVSQLASVFVTESMENLQTVINYEIMEEKGNKNWFTIPLPDGVEKTADVYIFSDPTCGYCRKIHTEKEQYDELGIQMHIIPYPRQGLTEKNPGYTQWIDAACAVDGGQAYHHLILGEPMPEADQSKDKAACAERVDQGYALGRDIALRGTPYIIGYANNGKKMMKPGYVPIGALAQELGVMKQEQPTEVLVPVK